MEQVVETIQEISSRLEREVEWPLTDYIDPVTVKEHLRVIYANLQMLEKYAEQIEEVE